jgi:hypothetical protein
MNQSATAAHPFATCLGAPLSPAAVNLAAPPIKTAAVAAG